MRIGLLYDVFKYILAGTLCFLVAGILFTSLREAAAISERDKSFDTIPNYNYVSDVEKLRDDGKLSEALELTRFILQHPDMPGQEEARRLKTEIQNELSCLWGHTKRLASGFVKGSGNSIEEITGAITSDMIIYGDIRDLCKQGYFKVTGKETDSVIAALAGIGLLTEVVDFADWVPAVLKAFRKIGSLTKKFADWIISACKKSAKALKLEGALKTTFKNITMVVDKMGLARTSSIFKHIDTPSDFSAIAKVAEKNVDAAYFTIKNGGKNGVKIINDLGNTDFAVDTMAKAAQKGPHSIQWLKSGGKGRKYVLRTRYGARILKAFKLDHPQKLIIEVLKKYPEIAKVLWLSTLLLVFFGMANFIEAGNKIRNPQMKIMKQIANIKERLDKIESDIRELKVFELTEMQKGKIKEIDPFSNLKNQNVIFKHHSNV